MATVIRMKRGGRTHAPYYRVVVMDGRSRTKGRVIEEIGVYHPAPGPNRASRSMPSVRSSGCSTRPAVGHPVHPDRQGVMDMYAKGTKPGCPTPPRRKRPRPGTCAFREA